MKELFLLPSGPERIPSLDGLRALSISLVLFSHLLGTRNFLGRAWAAYTGDLGNLGVRFFFVISGFLITTLLLQELERKGEISLGRFYLRRTLRIFPAFYACLAAVAVLDLVGYVELNPHDLLFAGSYTINYRTAVERSWNVGHMWSLAVEEQFYLLWPAALCLLGRSRALCGAALLLVLVPLIRLGTWYFFPQWTPGIKWQFQTVCDSLATGCVLAGLQGWWARRPFLQRIFHSNAVLLLPALAVLMNVYVSGRPRLNYLLGQTFMNVCIALFIQHCIHFPGQWAGRLLNLRPMVVLGVLSYSLYLWQQLFLNHYSTAFLCSFPLNLGLALAAAVLSYVCVERPCLEFRKRIEGRIFGRAGRPISAAATKPLPDGV